ncbi:MAG: hypothetical protein ACYDCS_08760 [Candidatus Dormibacteria bacterium]
MYGSLIVEMAQVVEQEHMQRALMARAGAQARRARRRQLGPGRIGRARAAFWAPRGVIPVDRRVADGAPADLTPCADC